MCVIDLTNVELINTHFIEIYSDLFEIKSLKWCLMWNYLAESEKNNIHVADYWLVSYDYWAESKWEKSQYYTTNENPLKKVKNHFSSGL
jgi:hypothetical protein